jgi:hypothetical protein
MLGRSVITMSAPKSKANDPRAAKRLTADQVKLFGAARVRIWRREANGNAELFVDVGP